MTDKNVKIVAAPKQSQTLQKPTPDWGRRGTQPKGTVGAPPPPNGKIVATKPKSSG